MPRYSLLIDPESQAKALAAVSRKLIAPENAVVRGTTKKWTETLEVTKTEMGPSEKENALPNTITVRVQFTVPADIDSANLNNGKPFTQWFDIWKDAFHNPSHAKYKANNMNVGKLNALLRVAYPELPHGETIDYGEYFSADEGEVSPMVGLRTSALIREYVYNGETYQSVDEFIAIEE